MGIVDTIRADLVVRAPDGRAVLVVEVKGSMRFAEVYKRALALAVDAFHPPYAMLAMPNRILLFHIESGGELTDSTKPVATFETRRLVERYLPTAFDGASVDAALECVGDDSLRGALLDAVEVQRGAVLESVLHDWLGELAQEDGKKDVPAREQMASVGLLEQIAGAETFRDASARLRW